MIVFPPPGRHCPERGGPVGRRRLRTQRVTVGSQGAWLPGEAGLEGDVCKAVAQLGDDPINFSVQVGFQGKALVPGALEMPVQLLEGFLAALTVPFPPPGHSAGSRLPAWLLVLGFSGMVRAAWSHRGLKRTGGFGSQKRNFRKGFKLKVERTKLPALIFDFEERCLQSGHFPCS